MLRFLSRPGVGIEITSRAVRVGAVSSNGSTSSVLAAASLPLTAGIVVENYGIPNVRDQDGLISTLQTCIQNVSSLKISRIGLSLADSIFRVQNLDFDELPASQADRERLIRWRLEKGSAFDIADTIIRYQVFPRQEKGFSTLVCIAKKDVIVQFEDLVRGLGIDVWQIGLSSFHALNFYAPLLHSRDVENYAFVWVTDTSYSTIIMENGSQRFYRFREIKGGTAENSIGRILRELEDSLHFYTHHDRLQSSEIGRLMLAGDAPTIPLLAEELLKGTTLDVEVLTPSAVAAGAGDDAAVAVAALGAGGAV